MSCTEAQPKFSPYLDDALTPHERAAVDAHLDVCPFCRLRLSQMRAVGRRLANLSRPTPPANLRAEILNAVSIERAAPNAGASAASQNSLRDWLRPRLMPYTIGALASLLLFFIVASALRPHMQTLRDLAAATRQEPISPTDAVWFNGKLPLSPQDYAASRAAFSSESPSLDPNSALAALISMPPANHYRHRSDDDDMVFVADVDARGDARLAQVIQPPRDKQMLRELESALRQTPAFVPASMDGRPDTMRVVFVMEKVKVEDKAF